jgi:poly-gamma-glutamate synthesis protein (capsule biosynthesis protein)
MRGYFYITLITIHIWIAGCTMASPSKNGIVAKGKDSLVIGFTGDVMLGRLVNEQISTTSYTYPWGDVLALLRDTDLNIINLETTLTTSTREVPKVFNYKADPDKVQSLTEARIDVVNLANNHILDFAEEGLLETITVLDSVGIQHVGAGRNKAEAAKPVILKKKNITLGILGYTDNEPGWEAQEDAPGTNYIEIGKGSSRVEKEIEKLKGNVDIVILSIHWGPNMRQRPTKEFHDFAHRTVDTGVDILHGHSAHIFQGIEIYHKGVIFYDTGDFVDDYYVTPSLRNDRSFLYLVEVDQYGLKKIELIPVLISYMQVNKATQDDYRETVRRMRRLSEEFGTTISETDQGVFVELK